MNKHLFTIVVLFLLVPVFLSCIPEEDIPDACVLPNDSIITADSYSTDTHSTDTHSTDIGIVASVRIEKYMDQNSAGNSVQGAAVFGDYMFQFQDKNHQVFIYDLKNRSFHSSVKMNSNGNNHCNNASFSTVYYSEDDIFPLLYVSGSSIGTFNQVQVYRVIYTGNTFRFDKVQEIVLPKSTSENCLYWTGVIMDNDNDYMYVYANHKGAQICKFAIPDINSETVMLADEDILDRFTLEPFIHQQGATCMNNQLYIMDGVPAWGDTVYLHIIDLKKQNKIVRLDLSSHGFIFEPEGLDFYNGQLMCATNSSKGIFTISINNSNRDE